MHPVDFIIRNVGAIFVADILSQILKHIFLICDAQNDVNFETVPKMCAISQPHLDFLCPQTCFDKLLFIKISYRNVVCNMNGKVQLDNLGIDGRIVLKWIALMF